MGRVRQKFHLEPDRGLLNDPNGLAYYKGQYYVFFQWNRFAKDHSYKEWGLFRSPDLMHWIFEGSAMLPDQPYDKDGVYSGSACVIDNKLCLFYTGNAKTDGRRQSSQCLAVTEDGRKYLKHGIVLDKPEGYTEHFRDPKVFRVSENDGNSAGGYFMVVGAQQTNGKGAIALARSEDGVHWKPAGDLGTANQCEMVECPDLFELDGRHVLLFNPQKRDNVKNECGVSFSAYKITDFDASARKIADPDLDQYSRMDQGFDFYAPQTFCDSRGRRILFAWMSRMEREDEEVFSAGEPNIHCLTLPRQLHVKNGKLYQNVPEELENLKGREIPLENFVSGDTGISTGRTLRAHFPKRTAFLSADGHGLNKGIKIIFPEDDTTLIYDPGERSFTFRRCNWVHNTEEERHFWLDSLDAVEIWLDQSSIEIFLNHGEYVLTSRIYVKEQAEESRTAVLEGISEEVQVTCREIVPV